MHVMRDLHAGVRRYLGAFNHNTNVWVLHPGCVVPRPAVAGRQSNCVIRTQVIVCSGGERLIVHKCRQPSACYRIT